MEKFTGKQKVIMQHAVAIYKTECEKDMNRWRAIANRNSKNADVKGKAEELADWSKRQMDDCDGILKTMQE